MIPADTRKWMANNNIKPFTPEVRMEYAKRMTQKTPHLLGAFLKRLMQFTYYTHLYGDVYLLYSEEYLRGASVEQLTEYRRKLEVQPSGSL